MALILWCVFRTLMSQATLVLAWLKMQSLGKDKDHVCFADCSLQLGSFVPSKACHRRAVHRSGAVRRSLRTGSMLGFLVSRLT